MLFELKYLKTAEPMPQFLYLASITIDTSYFWLKKVSFKNPIIVLLISNKKIKLFSSFTKVLI